MKNLITITLLFIAQLSFGQDIKFRVIEPTDTTKYIAFTKDWFGRDSFSEQYLRVSLTGETGLTFYNNRIEVLLNNNLTVIDDTTRQVKSILQSVFLEHLIESQEENTELKRKLKFYEDRFGKINGSLDSECIELLPAVKPPQSSVKPKKKYNNKRT